ncbi:MAG: cytochrome c [Gammaproteobacteria bacterium]|nr:cytochrome c [Gammaproteobacteria bacterium]
MSTRNEIDLVEYRKRGEYLARAGNCISCHTVENGKPMAGGLPFETPFGTLYSTNITPDPETGIGTWSEQDFFNSLRQGVRPDGQHLYPVFPFTAFTKLTNSDITSLFAYLRTIEPVRQSAPENELRFPYNLRMLIGLWKNLYFEAGEFQADPDQSDIWNQGAYLVEALAHCGTCHSPRNRLGAIQPEFTMSGGEYLDQVPDGHYRLWSAPNLTGSDRGLGLWSPSHLREYLKTSRNAFLESFGPMNEVILNGTSHLTSDDIDLMVIYLKSLPAIETELTVRPDPQVIGRGRTVYNLHCGTCHLPTGEGDPEMAPRLNQGSLVVQSASPASMINVILYGPQLSNHSLDSQWRESMGEFQYLLDDEEVAAAATYVRNSWDNSAGLVTPEQVARQR